MNREPGDSEHTLGDKRGNPSDQPPGPHGIPRQRPFVVRFRQPGEPVQLPTELRAAPTRPRERRAGPTVPRPNTRRGCGWLLEETRRFFHRIRTRIKYGR